MSTRGGAPGSQNQASAARSRTSDGGPDASRAERLEALWASYHEERGDELRNRIVESYQKLVHDVVRRFATRLPRMVDRGDLYTAGNVGLMAAVEAFDPDRSVRFEAYGERRIRGALLDELRAQDWLPRPWRQRLEQQKRTVEALRSELGRHPADHEVARRMEIGLEEYESLFGTALPGTPSGAMPVSDADSEYASALEVVPDTRNDAPGERLSREEQLRLVAQKLTRLEYRIVYLKYWQELPMREIGELTGLSESRVCKIHTRLLERLKDRFRVGLVEEVV